jgi:hypothetical protein
MHANDSRGQESPARQSTRLLTDGGEDLDNERVNELLDGVTGEGSFELTTDHASMGADGFEIDIEADIAPGEVYLVADSDDPEGEYAMIIDAADAAHLADVLVRVAAEAQERGDR